MAAASRGVLFIGGHGPSSEIVAPIMEHAEMVVAADSGYDLARSMGITPDLLVGDMDSLSDFEEAGRRMQGRVHAYGRAKDETDTEIGLRVLQEHGMTDAIIIGGGGGRLDHLVGILSLFERSYAPKRWFTAHEEIVHIDGTERFEHMRGVVCSFFPVGETVAMMRTSGLRWPLDGLAWRHGDVGISNYGVEDTVTVEMRSGRLIMLRNFEEREDV